MSIFDYESITLLILFLINKKITIKFSFIILGLINFVLFYLIGLIINETVARFSLYYKIFTVNSMSFDSIIFYTSIKFESITFFDFKFFIILNAF